MSAPDAAMLPRHAIQLRSPLGLALGLLLAGSGVLSAQTQPAPASPQAAPLGQPFATKYARFQPVPFDALPGWNSDTLRESLAVFARSCQVLSRKSAWSAVCAELGAGDDSSNASAREFFEAHFQAYQVMNPDESTSGRITGYYEPKLDGRSTRNAQYRFPVYGTPRDLYELDARSLSGAASQWLRIDGDRLLAAAPGTAGAREYTLALGDDLPGLADKRYRVRIAGDRIVPYYNRQQIESQGIDAPVLAWVDDAYALYSMQVQGSGKIQLQDGRIVRVAYAEQNGQPFLPNASASEVAQVDTAIKTRGLHLGAASAAARAGDAPSEDVAQIIARLKQGAAADPATTSMPPAASPTPTPARDPRAAEGNAQVQAIIATLLHGSAARTTAAPTPMPAAAPATAPKARDPQVQAMIAQLLGAAPPPASAGATTTSAYNGSRPTGGGQTARRHHGGTTNHADAGSHGAGAVSGIGDPSYVFFRVIPDGPQGPLGALGVPLTAGRSLAVDPRTTPLGAPVFITTAAPGGAGSLDRLMFAQDTGGAIRGSVRGDFFWGYGEDAGSLAAAMNANGHMWLLLPRGLTLGALNPKVRTRGLGDSAAAPDCVIPDGESCVEN